jgi:hypothetical protein
MTIGKFIKAALLEYGYEFKASDTVAFVNWKLRENNEWIYVATGDYGLAIYDNSERGA